MSTRKPVRGGVEVVAVGGVVPRKLFRASDEETPLSTNERTYFIFDEACEVFGGILCIDYSKV
jgi:hypothetical protein